MHWIRIKNDFINFETIVRVTIREDAIFLISREGYDNKKYTLQTDIVKDKDAIGEKLTLDEFVILKVSLEKILLLIGTKNLL